MNFTRFCVIGSGRLARACFDACFAASGDWLPILDPEERTLVVSARSSLLLPPAMVNNPKLFIVNFHDSLLPRHRGRNAPAWAIFEQDRFTGITWHRIAEKVDHGMILAQTLTPIWRDATALTLTRALIDSGIKSFRPLLENLLYKPLAGWPPMRQEIGGVPINRWAETFHYGRDKPNGGVADPSWSAEKRDAFDRAMNYGGLDPWK